MILRYTYQKIFTCLLTLSLLLLNLEIQGTPEDSAESKTVYKIVLNEEIMPSAWRLIDKAVDKAETHHVDYILLKINTYGGRLDIADSIRTKLLNASPVCLAFIDNNAASAGALISIACDSIYMVKGATIGAATVVNETGEQLPDKYQSYMRGMMRSTAEAQGRDPNIAEAMVDPQIHVPGISDSLKVLTFTTSEAIENNYCEGQVENIEALFKSAGISEFTIIEHQLTSLDKIIHFFLNPMVSGLLMMLIFGGIYFELQSPGVGFPLAAALFGAVLFFLPHYLEGLAENWEILLFLAGIILLGLEIFYVPGFGILGIVGFLMIFGGLTLALLQNHQFNFSLTGFDDIAAAMFRILLSILISTGLIILFGKNILKSKLFQKLVLQDVQDVEEGYTVEVMENKMIAGKTGLAVTPLRPSGKIEIDGERFDATTEGEYIEKGETISVIKSTVNQLIVRKSNS